ncbi:MAG: MgtC/SapB family protein [bacterium]
MNIDIILFVLPSLLFALVLGGVIGVERTLAGKTAGMRTYALVAMGSSLFVLVSRLIANNVGEVDHLKLAPAIITAAGFIGAGLVFHQGNSKITGLTSAAGLWVSAGIGMACGFGRYDMAMVAAILTVVVFTVFWLVETKLLKKVSYDRLEMHHRFKDDKDDEGSVD